MRDKKRIRVYQHACTKILSYIQMTSKHNDTQNSPKKSNDETFQRRFLPRSRQELRQRSNNFCNATCTPSSILNHAYLPYVNTQMLPIQNFIPVNVPPTLNNHAYIPQCLHAPYNCFTHRHTDYWCQYCKNTLGIQYRTLPNYLPPAN